MFQSTYKCCQFQMYFYSDFIRKEMDCKSILYSKNIATLCKELFEAKSPCLWIFPSKFSSFQRGRVMCAPPPLTCPKLLTMGQGENYTDLCTA